ncbi:MAG: acyloxyacyl hydrolase [Crocinitomicaceae bacterium]
MIILLWQPSNIFGQSEYNARGLYVQSKGGFLMAHRSTMAHLVRKNSYGFECGFIKHLQAGAKHADKHFPAVGMSFEFRNFGYDEVLGKAFSISHFINTPIFQSDNFFIDFQYGTGIGYLTNKYDLIDNPKNNAIGSHFNAKVALKLIFTKYFNQNFVGLGLEMTHFSNGVMTFPNLGLNVPSLFVQLGFLNGQRAAYDKRKSYESEVFQSTVKHNLLLTSIFTAKQVRANPNLPKRYPVFGLRGTYKYTYSKRWSWDASIDLIHNEANLFVYPDSIFTRSDVLQIGLYAGAAYHFYKSEIVMGLGYYLRDKINPIARMYNKIGYRYYFTQKWFGLFNVRANLGKADFFEFGFGYKLR